MLMGRSAEKATIDQLLADARSSRSSVLVIRGEAGIGKSALLDHAAAAAADMRVMRCAGVEFESTLPFAGLHQLLRRLTDRLDCLPAAQAQALRAALGLGSAAGGDRFLVGLAVLTLLADLAEEQPLLCLIDDAHWLDQSSAEALLFAARRLETERVAIVFAARDLYAPEFPAPGLAELRPSRLDSAASADLLALYAADLDHHRRAHVLREAEGNPLALLELTTAQRQGRAASPYPAISTTSKIEQAFADRISRLPEQTRTLLLVIAADDSGDPATVFKAAARLGAAVADLEPAERHSFVHLHEDRLTFRHPLIRSAVYHSAPASRRFAAHRALAASLHNDRAAWHLAAATTEPDEHVAAALERSARRAQDRGSHAALATAYERAAALSPDLRDRGRRLSAAARAALEAGQVEHADSLAERASLHLTEPVLLGRMAEVRAMVADLQGALHKAHSILSHAAQSLIEVAPDTAGRMLVQAAGSAWVAGDLSAAEKAADQARTLPAARRARAMAHLASTDVAQWSAAVRELDEEEPESSLRAAVWAACLTAFLRDDQRALRRAFTVEQKCRTQGAIGVLPHALLALSSSQVNLGRHREARASGLEGMRVAENTGQFRIRAHLAAVLAHLAAVAGERERHAELEAIMETVDLPDLRHEAARSMIMLELGLGRCDAAAERVADHTVEHELPGSWLADYVEVAVRAGRRETADKAFTRYVTWADHIRQPAIDAIVSRCRALMADDRKAEPHYQHALRLGSAPFEHARTQLHYGEWLRRAHRRVDARPHLRSAVETFQRLGATPWADRAGSELRATGESRTASHHEPDLLGRLTPQELQVVRLAATGLSNKDIGAQLFLSPRTVGYHLYNAYPKLGVASRGELANLDLVG
ncbi:LuxR family transcriptional regulator [Nonomuraea longispora]|uniref:LuxR family transcriptional regulator n=1 Tax=Nonomuraea longispora TaxID=1848320 RepID=A0A4R4MZE8_9ACTN|nr:LuxR family transcriptional regulator [Nonomuraea longispora]TDC01615.1 LuxR family transcriptional regulator [Nonomuraea longispora]